MTRRRWIADTWNETTATLTGTQAAHLARVLRAQPGMEFDVVTGQRVWRAAVSSVEESAVTFQLLEEVEAAATLDLTVLLSVFKFDRLEWAVEKLTELGVARIEPVLARRTEKHLAQAAVSRVERWRRIALEAAKQSRRTSIPHIGDPLALREVLGRDSTPTANSLRMLLTENEKQQTLVANLQAASSWIEQPAVRLAVGPEGGWTIEEESIFREQGWTSVSLGPTILRAETAAIAAVAVTAAWLNG